MVLVRAAENEMLQPYTGLQVQPHKDHKYRDLFPSEIKFCVGLAISTFTLLTRSIGGSDDRRNSCFPPEVTGGSS